jgi:TetR/AcrR family transcriptional repressor of nem operon
MTESATQPPPGKRERLVASAADLMHRQGVERTTLAQVATDADVPPGNLYYYFKTREDLVSAVIDARLGEIRALLAELDTKSTPKARLKGLARQWAEGSDVLAVSGCPIGTLTTELSKQDCDPDRRAAMLFTVVIDWAREQFRQLGHRDAHDLAVALLAAVEGAILLANTLRDPNLIRTQIRRVGRWIDSL